MRDDRERLDHILEAIERIEKYAAEGEEHFREEELVQNWMLRHLQVIGEATRALSKEFRNQYPEVPWDSIIGMRHILVHEYFGIDLDLVWRTVSKNIPELKESVKTIIHELGDSEEKKPNAEGGTGETEEKRG
jgi:uncharacterized protein with HEPN domain